MSANTSPSPSALAASDGSHGLALRARERERCAGGGGGAPRHQGARGCGCVAFIVGSELARADDRRPGATFSSGEEAEAAEGEEGENGGGGGISAKLLRMSYWRRRSTEPGDGNDGEVGDCGDCGDGLGDWSHEFVCTLTKSCGSLLASIDRFSALSGVPATTFIPRPAEASLVRDRMPRLLVMSGSGGAVSSASAAAAAAAAGGKNAVSMVDPCSEVTAGCTSRWRARGVELGRFIPPPKSHSDLDTSEPTREGVAIGFHVWV